MKSSSKFLFASGIVSSLVVAYGISKKYTMEEIQEKSKILKEELALIIDDLIQLSKEVLERIYKFINEYVKILIFKVEGLVHKLDLKMI